VVERHERFERGSEDRGSGPDIKNLQRPTPPTTKNFGQEHHPVFRSNPPANLPTRFPASLDLKRNLRNNAGIGGKVILDLPPADAGAGRDHHHLVEGAAEKGTFQRGEVLPSPERIFVDKVKESHRKNGIILGSTPFATLSVEAVSESACQAQTGGPILPPPLGMFDRRGRGTMKRRIVYVSGSGGSHDEIFVRKLKTLEPDWITLFVTLDPLQERMGRDAGVATVFLNPDGIPYDDWDRKGAYPIWQRHYLRSRFAIHRERFRRQLLAFRPDIVHTGWLQTEGLLAAKEKRSPLVVMEWGSDILIRPFDNRRNYRKTKFVLSQADLLVCDARIALEKEREILGHRNTPSLLIPWGIDRTLFHPEERRLPLHRPLRLVMLKNLVPVSRIEIILKAASRLLRGGMSDFRIDIYGDGPLRGDLEKQAAERHLCDRLRFHGQKAHASLPNVLRESDLFVSCNESEGTSVAMMEAMACGTIPVVTKLPAYEEWIVPGKNGFLCDVGDADALARQIREISTLSSSRIEEIRRRNYAVVAEHFDWNRNFGRLAEKYGELASLSPVTRGYRNA
jgi:glycosyltransferase involved in cell wall biosynthesis